MILSGVFVFSWCWWLFAVAVQPVQHVVVVELCAEFLPTDHASCQKWIKTIISAHRPRETGLKVEFYAVATGGGQFERFNKRRTRWTLQKTCCEWAMTVNIRGAARVGACTATLFLIPLLWAMLSLCSHVQSEVSWGSDQGVERDLSSQHLAEVRRTCHPAVFWMSAESHQSSLQNNHWTGVFPVRPSLLCFTGSNLPSAEEFGFRLDYCSCWRVLQGSNLIIFVSEGDGKFCLGFVTCDLPARSNDLFLKKKNLDRYDKGTKVVWRRDLYSRRAESWCCFLKLHHSKLKVFTQNGRLIGCLVFGKEGSIFLPYIVLSRKGWPEAS